jgi:two-component system LytT family sensor kinase
MADTRGGLAERVRPAVRRCVRDTDNPSIVSGADRLFAGVSRADLRRGDGTVNASVYMMRLLRTPRFWTGCLVGWISLALVEAASMHFDALRAGRDSRPGWLLFDRALADVVWFAVATVVFLAMERAMAAPIRAGRLAIRFSLIGLALAPIYITWGPTWAAFVHGDGVPSVIPTILRLPVTTLLWDVFLYSMITLSASMVVMSRRSRRHERAGIELRTRLAHAELELLRAQLEPHFLFNALNTIAGLIRVARPDLATTALAKLSQLLRYVVEASRQDRVPLAWELEFVASYLELQQMRFGARLQFAIHETTPGRGCDVPPLLLQPLIENAVVHGVARTSDPVTIDIHIATIAGELRLAVDNTRDRRAEADRESTGVGLRNTRQRLERMYGDAFAFAAGPDGPDHYRVTISLPHGAAYA